MRSWKERKGSRILRTTDYAMQLNERIDDLQCKGYRLIQNTACFCFGMDAVLLSSFAKVQKGGQALDLGTGNGVIPILMQAKNPGAHFTGLEIQEESYSLAVRNTELNGLKEDIDMVLGDIKEAKSIFKGRLFDAVTSNPPYMTEKHGLVNPDSAKAVARHELLCTLDDVVRAAADCLKVRGHFYMVHRPKRLAEIFLVLKKYGLEPKKMRMVYPYYNKPANMVLIEAVKGGRAQLDVEPPLIVYNEDGGYTKELLELYGDGGEKSVE